MNITDLSKLSFFKVGKYKYENKNVCDFRNIPRPHFCMGLIIKGNAAFKQEGYDEFSLKEGDIVFVPITSKYISKWEGYPDILYISFHFAFCPNCGISEQNNFILQKVCTDDFERSKNNFLFCYEHYNDNNIAMQMRSVGIFFNILSEVVPKLSMTTREQIDERIEKAIEYINLNAQRPLSVESLAKISGMSIPNFHILFKKYTKMTPIEYKNHISISYAMRLLKSDERASIEEISEMLGFESSSYFRRVFKKITGKTPLEYKKTNIEL